MPMFSRFWSMTRTIFNPEFAISIARHDAPTTQFNSQSFGQGYEGGQAAKVWFWAFAIIAIGKVAPNWPLHLLCLRRNGLGSDPVAV